MYERSHRADFLIAGDFNFFYCYWHGGNEFLHCNTDRGVQRIDQINVVLNNFNELNFYQFNDIKNLGNNTLDLVFFTLVGLHVNRAPEPLIACDTFHPALLIVFPVSITESSSQSIAWRRDFKRADYAAINQYLGNVLWDDEFRHRNVDESVDFLYFHLNHAILLYVPLSPIRSSLFFAWFSGELITLIKVEKLAHFKYKRFFRHSDYIEFKDLRSRCSALSKKCWKKYAQSTEYRLRSNAKSFWCFVKFLRANRSSQVSIYFNNEYINDHTDIANCFADYFESVYSDDSGHYP